ncbi:MAG: phage holin family protein [Candidatus Promineifilaceae bacterium]
MRDLLRVLIRIAVVTLIEAVAVLVMARLLAGITIPGPLTEQLRAAITVAVVLGLLNALIRPLIVFAGLPINLYTVGLFTLFVNAGILLLAAHFLPDFEVTSLVAAILGSLVLALVNTFLTGLISIDQDYAFYDGVVSWLSRQNLGAGDQLSRTRGIILLEIDGLSYQRVQRAIELGLMPTMKRLLAEGTHDLSHVDCGFPSQSSSCQAGIMYGNNYNIPAFRWYIKDEQRLVVSNNMSDAAELNHRLFNGLGLLRGGTSINNLLSGEAARSLMTISTLRDNNVEAAPHSGYELTLVFLNPYLWTRAVILTFGDLLRELFQSFRQIVRDERPRVSRLNRFYPFLRAATNIFLRDVATNAVILDVMRGSPAIYTTFMGYDEIAHHAGPNSQDALGSLRGIDRSIARILDVVERKAPRPYDVFVLSDHGQSTGTPFRQRAGLTIGELLQSLAEGSSVVSQEYAAEEIRSRVTAILAEMERLHGHIGEGRTRADVVSRAGKQLGRRVKVADNEVPPGADMLVLAGGNLAHVYLPGIPGKVTAGQLDSLYPGLLEALAAHPDIGLVIVYMEADRPWAIGSRGARDLVSGTITGESDPLAPYGSADLRAAQLERVAQFPDSGDLMLISKVYEGQGVAAFEEHIGSHGGIGGEQTDAFLFHPSDIELPRVDNMSQLFPILNGRRNTPARAAPPSTAEPGLEPWSGKAIRAGFADWQGMLDRAARSLRLDRSVYGEVAKDPLATGQALVIAFLLVCGSLALPLLLGHAVAGGKPGLMSGVVVDVFGLLFCLILATLVGMAKGVPRSFTRSFNAIAFAGVGGFIAWFAVLDYAGPLFLLTGTLIIVAASWLAIQSALGLGRWQAVFIPLSGFLLSLLLQYI